MLFQGWIEAVSLAFETTTQQTAILVSLLSLVCLSVLVLIALGKESKKIEALMLVNISSILIFVYVEWLPLFTGTVMALIWALVGAYVIRETVGR